MPNDDFLRFLGVCIPHAIESHWDDVYAPGLAGVLVNIFYTYFAPIAHWKDSVIASDRRYCC
jgi:hypothetical protein